MTDQENTRLREVLKTIVPKIRRDRDRRMNEEDTKIGLIDPILKALGWDVQDWEEVHRESRAKAGDNPVDYVLKIGGRPWLLIEAKALDEKLSNRKWIIQGLTYAMAADVEWFVLSNGDEYRFYKANARGEAEEKEFCRVRLSEEGKEAEAINALALLLRSNLDARLIEERATAHFVDRRVKEALCELVNPLEPEKGMVSLIRKKVPDLPRNEIIASFARLDVRIESAAPRPPTLPPPGDDTKTEQLQLDYWTAFKDVLESSNTVIKATKPHAANWMSFAIGRSGFCLDATASVQKRRIAAYLNIHGPERSAHFRILEEDKEKIERELGLKLEWREMQDKKQSHILWSSDDTDPTDRSKWPEQHALLRDVLDKLHRVFAPRIKNLTAGDYTPEEEK